MKARLAELKLARWIAIASALLSIFVLTLRAALGPFRMWALHVVVDSPFFAESTFWLAIVVLLWLKREKESSLRAAAERFPAHYLAAALGMIALAFWRNLADPFLSDDYIILNASRFSWNNFPASFISPGGDGSFRPLGHAYFQILKSIGGTDPFAWHLAGLGVHLLDSALVMVIAWKLWRDKAVALVACLVFGLHGTRPEAAVWTAGNFDLPATACVLGSISLAITPRTRWRTGSSLALIGIGILFKESAYAAPLVAAGIFASRGTRSIRWRWLAAASAIGAAALSWRWHLFHGPGGYIDRATGQPAILSLHPVTAAKGLLIRTGAVLLAPINWDAPRAWWFCAAVACTMAGILYLAARGRASMWLVAATLCAVLPAIHLVLVGQSLMGSRILYLAGAPSALLIANLAAGLRGRQWILCAVMLAGMAGILEHNLLAWHDAGLRARELCRAGVNPVLTYEGVPVFQNGFAECVALYRQR